MGDPQLEPAGGLSAQLVWQLEVRTVVLHDPTIPPSVTSVPQHKVPVPHWLVPVLPVQSSGSDGAWQVDAQLSAPLAGT
jgi:hypothetical protein